MRPAVRAIWHSWGVRESLVSEGVAVSVSFAGDLLETSRFAWPTWDEPPATTEVEKPSMDLFRQELAELPFFVDE